MKKNDYLRYCKFYRGEEDYPYQRKTREEEYKYIFWLCERGAINYCMNNNITDGSKIIGEINDFITNKLGMYHADWCYGFMTHKTLEKWIEYGKYPYIWEEKN